MFLFEIGGPFFIQKEKGTESPLAEVISETLDNGNIPLYTSRSDKCEIFRVGLSSFSSDSMELDCAFMYLNYPPNTFLA